MFKVEARRNYVYNKKWEKSTYLNLSGAIILRGANTNSKRVATIFLEFSEEEETN